MNDVTKLFADLLDLTYAGTVNQKVLLSLAGSPGIDCSALDTKAHAALSRQDLCRSIEESGKWKTVYPGDQEWDRAVTWNDPG